MSLSNIIIQKPAGYLLTDSGHFDRDTGAVAYMAPKFLMFEQLGIAMSARDAGHAIGAGLYAEMLHRASYDPSARTGTGMMAAMEEIFFAACCRQGATGARQDTACDVQILYYSPEHGRTFGYLIANNPANCKGQQAFTLHPVLECLSIPIKQDHALYGRDLSDPAQFDIVADGRALMEMQRRGKWRADEGAGVAGYKAAGTVYLTKVNASGMWTAPILRWDDQPGQPVTPIGDADGVAMDPVPIEAVPGVPVDADGLTA